MKTNDQRLVLPACPSTNTELMQLLRERNETIPSLYSVIALDQTQGRGQRGSSWVSAPGENLTFSFVVRPGLLPASRQYAVCEMAAYGLMKTIARYLNEEQKAKLKIKWPNDIYYDERKIAGVLIEHSITGEYVDYSVVGIGLNLNQTEFPEDLPNPISLKNITGQHYDLEEVHSRLMKRYGFMREPLQLGEYAEVHRQYKLNLWRRTGLHRYHDASGSFLAEIKDVLLSGEIVLEREDGTVSTYAFKGVCFDAD